MRQYFFRASHASFRVTDKEGSASSKMNPRAVAIELFRRIYGRVPTQHYFCARHIYWAFDRRGNHVEVERIDHFSPQWWYETGLQIARDITGAKWLALPERRAA